MTLPLVVVVVDRDVCLTESVYAVVQGRRKESWRGREGDVSLAVQIASYGMEYEIRPGRRFSVEKIEGW